MPENPQLAMSSIKAHISESRIDESVRRILRYKYGPMSEWKRLDESNFGNEANRAIVDKAK
jgi:beta-glucosidase-like glycosyl hydrolase